MTKCTWLVTCGAPTCEQLTHAKRVVHGISVDACGDNRHVYCPRIHMWAIPYTQAMYVSNVGHHSRPRSCIHAYSAVLGLSRATNASAANGAGAARRDTERHGATRQLHAKMDERLFSRRISWKTRLLLLSTVIHTLGRVCILVFSWRCPRNRPRRRLLTPLPCHGPYVRHLASAIACGVIDWSSTRSVHYR